MSVQANITISFETESIAEVEELISGLSLPPGAFVSSSVTQPVIMGEVDDAGEIKATVPPDPLVE